MRSLSKVVVLVGSCGLLTACDLVLGLDKFQSVSTTGTGGSTGSTSSTGGTGGGDCPAGTADCGGAPGDCETSTDSDLSNCGACGKLCAGGHGTAKCAAGSCELTCEAGAMDCNLDGADGCEAVLATDKQNCGSCKHACLGECTDGHCQPAVLAGQLAHPGLLAVNESYVIWANQIGDITKVPIDGGATSVIVFGEGSAGSVDLSKTHVFWTDPNQGTIRRAAIAGGDEVSFVDPDGTADVVVAGSLVFWTAPAGGAIKRSGQAFGSITPMLNVKPYHLAADATDIYWTGGDSVGTAGQDALSPSPLFALNGSLTYDIAVDATSVYFVISDDGTGTPAIMRMNKDGSQVVRLASVQQYKGVNMAVDDSNVFWNEYSEGAIRKVPKTGGSATIVAQGQANPVAVVLDDQRIYWTNAAAQLPSGGSVMALEKAP